jgi:simple sugar transport system permease protein
MALAPIVASLAVTCLLIVLVGHDPVAVFTAVVEGAFRNSTSLAGVFNFWIPLTLASLGLVVTFRAGLWNIGVEGQMAMGAIFASWAAQYLALPSPILIPIEILVAMLGGALWAGLTGLLKTRLGVNEIFGGVALNSLASVLTIFLISGPWQPAGGGSAQSTAPFPPDSLLPSISPEFPVSLLALVITVVALIAIFLALRGTRWGLELKATGKNARSALLLGVATERSVLSAFIVCGALAGIAGAYRVLFTYSSLRPLTSGGIGFLALLIVLMVSMRILLTPLVAFIVAAMYVGSTRLRVVLQLDQSLAGVLQGILVLFILMSGGVRERLMERKKNQQQPDAPPFEPVAPISTEAPRYE